MAHILGRASPAKSSPTHCSPVVAAAIAEPDAIGELHTVTLLKESELVPLEAPKLDVKSAAVLLASEHWHEQFAGIDLLRRLARHHPASLASALTDTMPALSVAAGSLRSALARNAMCCVDELCRAVPDQVTAVDLDAILLQLLLHSASDKRFIRDVALAALSAIGTHCATADIVSLCVLRAPAVAKKPESRAQTAVLLSRALRANGPAFVRGLPAGADGDVDADAGTDADAAVPTGVADDGGDGSNAHVVSLRGLVQTIAGFVQGRTAEERRAGTEAARQVARALGKQGWDAQVGKLIPQSALALRRATTQRTKGKARVPLRERIMKQRQAASGALGPADIEVQVLVR